MRHSLIAAFFLALAPVAPAHAEVKLTIGYSETADLYQTMDNVALWWEGFNDPRYRAGWEARFGWSKEDQAWADRYREYRRRTFVDPSQELDVYTSPHGLFASSFSSAQGADPLGDYLTSQPDIASALLHLDTIMSAQDAQMLRGFFGHFEPKWRALLDESTPLNAYATALREKMSDAAFNRFVERAARFYGASADGEFRVYFTQFPPGAGTTANIMSGNVLLLNSPLEVTFEQGGWDTIVGHEFAHYLSSQQPEAQKRQLSDRFLAICPLPEGANRGWMIEEPLAVTVGQVAYSQLVLGTPLDPRANWYFVPWIDITARTLAPSVVAAIENDMTLVQSSVVEEAAERCRDLTALAGQLAPPNNQSQ